ncbi:MAG: hypothetical protein ABW022_11200 [Actinoplanes sp.]
MIVNYNVSESMGSNEEGIKAYAKTVDEAVMAGQVSGPLYSACPECGVDFDNLDDVYADDQHIIMLTTIDTPAVVVGCEGYFVVDPNLVGIVSPNWQPVETAQVCDGNG